MCVIFFIMIYFILIPNSNATIIDKIVISPTLTFYNNYIFSSELQLNLEYTEQDYFVGGYFKKSSVNGNKLFNISNKNKYKITQIQTDNENYFYNLFFKKHLLDFNKDKLYFTIFFSDAIKYNKALEFTYANIYKTAGLQFDYSFNNIAYYFNDFVDKLPLNVFLSFSKDFDGIKNNITLGFNTFYSVNEVLLLGFKYNYFKDFKNKHNIEKLYYHRFYKIHVDDLSYEAHNFDFLINLSLTDIIINLKMTCSISEQWGNGCGFGVGFGL